MTGLPTSVSHMEWDPITPALSEVPMCKFWSLPCLPPINTILHSNGPFKMESMIVLLKDIH